MAYHIVVIVSVDATRIADIINEQHQLAAGVFADIIRVANV